jgi:bifunctional DNA-binding transcriptional regulator/antitoxin component of YhaV-PrlF toxin-antitoxin module
VLPKEFLQKLRVERNDLLFAVETPEGYLLTPYGPALEQQLRLGREIMSEHRDTLRALIGRASEHNSLILLAS